MIQSSAGGAEEGERRLAMRRQRGDEQAEGPCHVGGDDGELQITQRSAEAEHLQLARHQIGTMKQADDGQHQPFRANEEFVRQSETQAADCDERNHGVPTRLSEFDGLLHGGILNRDAANA